MKDTVAIVGSHPLTSKDFDFDRTDCDIWVFNEALATDWCKRADGVFQLHKPVIWRSSTNRNDSHHYEWLQSGDTPIIYMIDQYEDVPKSERYPLMEIMSAFPTAKQYFTSSVSYALALAVYKGYKIIEVYGVEMETGTEYGHQRTGVAYWVGFAEGQGIYVDYHSPKFFAAPLYGYEGDIQIPLEHYQKRMAVIEPHLVGTKSQIDQVQGMIDDLLNSFIKTYKTDLSSLDELALALGQNYHNQAMMEGAYKTNKHYLDKCHKMISETGEYLIVRQEFESYAHIGAKTAKKSYEKVKRISNALHRKLIALNTNEKKEVREKLVEEFRGVLANYVKLTADVGQGGGIMRENQVLVNEYDTYLRSAGIEPQGQPVKIEEQAEMV